MNEDIYDVYEDYPTKRTVLDDWKDSADRIAQEKAQQEQHNFEIQLKEMELKQTKMILTVVSVLVILTLMTIVLIFRKKSSKSSNASK